MEVAVGAGFGGAILAGIIALFGGLVVLGWGDRPDAVCERFYVRCEVRVLYPKLQEMHGWHPTLPRSISPLPPERPRYVPVKRPRPSSPARRSSRVPVG